MSRLATTRFVIELRTSVNAGRRSTVASYVSQPGYQRGRESLDAGFRSQVEQRASIGSQPQGVTVGRVATYCERSHKSRIMHVISKTPARQNASSLRGIDNRESILAVPRMN
jgi:hypothetical protein